MKWVYIIIETLTYIGLIIFGDYVGVGNIWFMFAAIITAHLILSFLNKLHNFQKRQAKRKNNIYKRIS